MVILLLPATLSSTANATAAPFVFPWAHCPSLCTGPEVLCLMPSCPRAAPCPWEAFSRPMMAKEEACTETARNKSSERGFWRHQASGRPWKGIQNSLAPKQVAI